MPQKKTVVRFFTPFPLKSDTAYNDLRIILWRAPVTFRIADGAENVSVNNCEIRHVRLFQAILYKLGLIE